MSTANPANTVVSGPPGHGNDQIEQVVERHEGYFVVEKIGEACEQIDRDDPRQHHS
jgi:hypothetical protein